MKDNGKRRRAGVFGIEVRVVVRNVEADEQDGEDTKSVLVVLFRDPNWRDEA